MHGTAVPLRHHKGLVSTTACLCVHHVLLQISSFSPPSTSFLRGTRWNVIVLPDLPNVSTRRVGGTRQLLGGGNHQHGRPEPKRKKAHQCAASDRLQNMNSCWARRATSCVSRAAIYRSNASPPPPPPRRNLRMPCA